MSFDNLYSIKNEKLRIKNGMYRRYQRYIFNFSRPYRAVRSDGHS